LVRTNRHILNYLVIVIVHWYHQFFVRNQVYAFLMLHLLEYLIDAMELLDHIYYVDNFKRKIKIENFISEINYLSYINSHSNRSKSSWLQTSSNIYQINFSRQKSSWYMRLLVRDYYSMLLVLFVDVHLDIEYWRYILTWLSQI